MRIMAWMALVDVADRYAPKHLRDFSDLYFNDKVRIDYSLHIL